VLPVVVGSYPGSPWIDDHLNSLQTDRQIVVHRDGGYEPPALRLGCSLFDRFLYLQDSTLILDPRFWDHIDAVKGSAWLSRWPPMFMGIHESAKLRPILDLIPDPINKYQSVEWESRMPSMLLGYETIWPDVADATAPRVELVKGRRNLILENEYFRKFKGTWLPSQIADAW
jgi:hypothetical protein